MTGLTGLGDLLPHRRAEAERPRTRCSTAAGSTAARPTTRTSPSWPAWPRRWPRPSTAPTPPSAPRCASGWSPRLRRGRSRPLRPYPAASPAPPAETATARAGGPAVATVAIASVVSGVGAAAASNRALPGDSLYGLKRQIESVELALARGDLAAAASCSSRPTPGWPRPSGWPPSSDDQRAGHPGRPGRDARRHGQPPPTQGAADLTDAYRETGDAEPLRSCSTASPTEQRERLDDLMALLDPGLRDAVRPLLAELVSVERAATILLGTSAAAATAAGAADLGAASGDGWAVSLLLDRTSGTAGDAGSIRPDRRPAGGWLATAARLGDGGPADRVGRRSTVVDGRHGGLGGGRAALASGVGHGRRRR